MSAGVEISIHIGQRVRHQDYKGQRVTGVVIGLSIEDRALMVDVALDAPIVIPPLSGEDRAVNIYRQHVPAHELAPFDEREELIAELVSAVTTLRDVSRAMEAENDSEKPTEEEYQQALAAADAAIAKATGSRA